MKIYTRTGDKGETGLRGNRRVRKDDPRVRAYGDVDELNCALGAALSHIPLRQAFTLLRGELHCIQAELFHVGAVLAAPPDHPDAQAFPADLAPRLEASIDRMTAQLPPLRRFILPGGSPAGAALHLARAVCRRAEREVVGLTPPVPESLLVYLNRLSDYLFTAARWVNARLARRETEWAGLK